MRFSSALLCTIFLGLASCITAPRSKDAESASNASSGPAHLLDNFESPAAMNGGTWVASTDSHNMGSKGEFKLEPGKEGKGNAGHFWGHVGPQRAPWPWASVGIGVNADMSPADLSSVKAVRFWVKGDGRNYKVAIPRNAVTDYANYHAQFTAPKKWTQLEIPLSSFKQADWGIKIPPKHTDVRAVEIQPLADNADFEIWIDEFEFVLDPKQPNPFAPKEEPPVQIDGTAFKLDDFEGEEPVNGAVWAADFDKNNLGSVAALKIEDGGGERKNAAHFTGKMGKNVGKTWPWTTLAVNIHPDTQPTDLSAVRGIRFWVKGGGQFKVAITRKAVTDYGNFAHQFAVSKEWKQVTIPIEKLKQPDWAVKVAPGFPDALAFQINPITSDAEFELWVDDVEFILDPSKPNPFPIKDKGKADKEKADKK